MTQDENDGQNSSELDKLKDQVEILQQQLALVKAQSALDAARQTQEAQLTQTIAETLKNQVVAQYSLESEKAKLPLAELAGIKEALSDMKLPTGKEGTVTIATGTAGTALLRSKKQMLMLLNSIANELKEELPDGAVIVTESQLDQACQADFTLKMIKDQIEKLNIAVQQAAPRKMVFASIGGFAAAAYSVGFVLDTVNSLAKLFRVDRKIDIFAEDEEAVQMLGYLLEGNNSKFVAKPTMLGNEAKEIAFNLLEELNNLLKAIHEAEALLVKLKKIEDDEAKTRPTHSQLPEPKVIVELKAQLEPARALFDSLHPTKKPEAFWAQVKGQLISHAIANRDRLILEAKAQAIQITETRWWASNRMCTSGEVQAAYKIINTKGEVTRTRVLLKASKAKMTSFQEMPEVSFPSG
jgi:hypothetical protein